MAEHAYIGPFARAEAPHTPASFRLSPAAAPARPADMRSRLSA